MQVIIMHIYGTDSAIMISKYYMKIKKMREWVEKFANKSEDYCMSKK